MFHGVKAAIVCFKRREPKIMWDRFALDLRDKGRSGLGVVPVRVGAPIALLERSTARVLATASIEGWTSIARSVSRATFGDRASVEKSVGTPLGSSGGFCKKASVPSGVVEVVVDVDRWLRGADVVLGMTSLPGVHRKFAEGDRELAKMTHGSSPEEDRETRQKIIRGWKGSDDAVRGCQEFTEGTEKLAANTPGDRRRKTVRLTARISKVVRLARSLPCKLKVYKGLVFTQRRSVVDIVGLDEEESKVDVGQDWARTTINL
ncbi:hypothetical protein BHM03_00045240 [Ensete ventricosum]|nr:hypothetical protein BHM03_00045240 [Ensete ventricosum]